MIRKFLFLFAMLYSGSCYCQQEDTLLNGFLEDNLEDVFRTEIDHLRNELDRKGSELSHEKQRRKMQEKKCGEAIAFLMLLHKLEAHLPVSNEESAKFINEDHSFGTLFAMEQPLPANTGEFDYSFTLHADIAILSWLPESDTSKELAGVGFLGDFPELRRRYVTGNLIFYFRMKSMASAPEITYPPLPAALPKGATAALKKQKAAQWMDYIGQLLTDRGLPGELDKYKKMEMKKLPGGNVDKLIELRQKYALFIEKKYPK